MNTNKLKQLLDTCPDKRAACREMGTTYQTVLNVINGADLRVSTLEGIAKYFNVPIGYFFDEASADGRAAHEVEIANLKGQVKGLKDAIKILKKEIKGDD